MKAKKKIVSDEILQEIVRRIVVAVQPEKIILFGSAAREEMGQRSGSVGHKTMRTQAKDG